MSSIHFVFLLFCSYVSLEKNMARYLKKNEFPSTKYALCQVWFKFDQWFWERDESVNSLQADRQTDNGQQAVGFWYVIHLFSYKLCIKNSTIHSSHIHVISKLNWPLTSEIHLLYHVSAFIIIADDNTIL